MTTFAITSLRCEYLSNPLGIDEPSPRLSWALVGNQRGLSQQAYRLRVASTPKALQDGVADLWDSDRVEDNRSTHIAYRGKTLESRMICFWQVEVWDEVGNQAVSEVASWSMGLLKKSDWKAVWIAADPDIIAKDPEAIAPTLTEPGTPACFRREIELSGAVRRATVYASARGLFELRLNGHRIGEDIFAPEWTDYDKRIQYRTYDVTGLMQDGSNVLGAILGDGWWSGFVGWQEQRGRYGSLENSLLVQLEVELQNGEVMTVGTDGSWQCGTGPILSSDFMMGEVYDGRRENGGLGLRRF